MKLAFAGKGGVGSVLSLPDVAAADAACAALLHGLGDP
jgi:hypothetical protein